MTRRAQLFAATSLDGYVAGPGGDRSWLFHDADSGYSAFPERIDTVLTDACAYESALALPQWPYAGRKVIVLTPRDDVAIASADTLSTSRPVTDVVAELRAREGRAMALVGGSEFVRDCFAAGVIDDVVVSIHPVILGGGTPLVATGTRCIALALVHERRYPSGLVQLVYRVERDAALTRG